MRSRCIRRTGSAVYVSDTMTSYRCDDRMAGDSVLTDLTRLKEENRELRFLNETMPCGFIKYTCEKTPRITYLNDRMLQILRFPEPGDGGFDHLELNTQNIYTMRTEKRNSRAPSWISPSGICKKRAGNQPVSQGTDGGL